jgi:activating signal cointegrator complex subunit 3
VAEIDWPLVPIAAIEEDWARQAFPGTKSLNVIQSKVFECCYHSLENVLVCAPTGAGKTNIAMLAFLQLLKQNVLPDGSIGKAGAKAVYIAPMKALAQEVRFVPLSYTFCINYVNYISFTHQVKPRNATAQ